MTGVHASVVAGTLPGGLITARCEHGDPAKRRPMISQIPGAVVAGHDGLYFGWTASTSIASPKRPARR